MRSTGILSACLFLLLSAEVNGQNLHWPVFVSTVHDNSFSEWYLLDDEDTQIGVLQRQWPLTDNWTEWTYEMEGLNGRIRQKWKDDPTVWELTADNELYTARMTYPGNALSWDIEGPGKKRATLHSVYQNMPVEWELKKSKLGGFKMKIRSEGDLRDWEIWESFEEDESPHFHLFLLFLVLQHSCPRY
jgi:hypothetical protein